MLRVVFDASPFGDGVTTSARVGDALLDLCDEAQAPVPFSCRDATCGTCAIEIVAGAELLDEPSARERLVLDALPSSPKPVRLACRARIARAGSLLRLRLAPV